MDAEQKARLKAIEILWMAPRFSTPCQVGLPINRTLVCGSVV